MNPSASPVHAEKLEIRLPRRQAQAADLDQDQEWCEVVRGDGAPERIRFHDYDRIYRVPGLYEQLFYTELKCVSPAVVRRLLEAELERAGAVPADLRILDLGAGNGMVAEELRAMGSGEIVGVDILPEAQEAAERDRPDVYAAYHVCDLTAPDAGTDDALAAWAPTCLTTVAALGFGDIPPRAFATAFRYLTPNAWVAMTIKDDFLRSEDPSGFSRLIRRMNEEGAIEITVDHRYQHRLAVSGEPLHYHAYIARKRGEIDPAWLRAAESGPES